MLSAYSCVLSVGPISVLLGILSYGKDRTIQKPRSVCKSHKWKGGE